MKKCKNPYIPIKSFIFDYFQIAYPKELPLDSIEAFELGRLLGIKKSVDLCGNSTAELSIKTLFSQQFKDMDYKHGPVKISSKEITFESGIIFGLRRGLDYCGPLNYLKRRKLKTDLTKALKKYSHYF